MFKNKMFAKVLSIVLACSLILSVMIPVFAIASEMDWRDVREGKEIQARDENGDMILAETEDLQLVIDELLEGLVMGSRISDSLFMAR